MIRKSITIEETEYEKLNNIAHREKISFSEVIRKAMSIYIKQYEDISLSEYIKKNCGYVTDDEEKEILKLLNEIDKSDLDPSEGSELTLEQIIKGNL